MDTSRFQEDDAAKGRKKKESKKDKKDKGYVMFEQESEEEQLVEENKNPFKLKKHSKPSFKFVKKEKVYKVKDKEDKKKDEKKKEDKGKTKKAGPQQLPEEEEQEPPTPIFGVPLAVVLERNKSHDGVELPAIFRECIDYIEHNGLYSEGIYRVSGVKSKVQMLKDMYNKGVPVSLKEFEPSVVASLLKQFLRELPEPVIPPELMPKFELVSTIRERDQLAAELSVLVNQLPSPNRTLLGWTMKHMMNVIKLEPVNKMSWQNVSIVLSPTTRISHRVLNSFYKCADTLFSDIIIRDYVPPMKPVSSHWSLDLPDSPSTLEEELAKQESLLDQLHKELMVMKDKEKEEQLWEVQRVVTGLKRKIKLIKKAQSSPAFRHSLEQSHMKAATENLAPMERSNSGSLGRKHRGYRMGVVPQGHRGSAIIPHTPSKEGPDFGAIETDSSAAKQSRHRRADSHGQSIEGVTGTKAQSLHLGAKPPMPKPARKNAPRSPAVQKAQLASVSDTVSNVTAGDVSTSDVSAGDDSVTEQPQQERKEKETREDEEEESGPAQDEQTEEQRADEGEIEEQETASESTADDLDQPVHVEDGESEHDEAISDQEQLTEEQEEEVRKPRTLLVHREPLKDSDDTPTTTPAIEVEEVEVEETHGPGQDEEKQEEEMIKEESSDTSGLQVQHKLRPGHLVPPPSEESQSKMTETSGSQAETAREEDNSQGVAPDVLYNALKRLSLQEIAAGSDHEEEQEPESNNREASEGTLEASEQEDLNEQVMSEFVQDFGIERADSLDQDDEFQKLQEDYAALVLEEEELMVIGAELRQKIENERSETERLREEINEVQAMREDVMTDEDSESEDSDESIEEEDLTGVLRDLLDANQKLEGENKNLTEKIYQETQICLQIKVKIKMIQQKLADTSASYDLLL